MTYVEWLRVRCMLKWTAIIFGALFLLAVAGRIAAGNLGGDVLARSMKLESDRGSKVSQTVLADGTKQTIVDNPAKHFHMVIDDRGYAGKHIEIRDSSSSNRRNDTDNGVIGSFHIEQSRSGGGTLTVIDTDGPTALSVLSLGGFLAAMIVATFLGAPFARENDGHLEIALTKPVDRLWLGCATLGVDALGILGALVIGMLFGFAVLALFQTPHPTVDASDAGFFGLGILGSWAWYAMLSAATASMKRGYGAVLGLSWPISYAIVGGARLPTGFNAVLTMIHHVCAVLATIVPLKYMHVSFVMTNGTVGSTPLASASLVMLAVLTLVYGAAAVIQWRRVEA